MQYKSRSIDAVTKLMPIGTHTAALSSSRNKKFPVENNEINQLGLNFNRNVSAAYFFFTEISSLSSLLSFKASLIFPITKSLFRCLLTRN